MDREDGRARSALSGTACLGFARCTLFLLNEHEGTLAGAVIEVSLLRSRPASTSSILTPALGTIVMVIVDRNQDLSNPGELMQKLQVDAVVDCSARR